MTSEDLGLLKSVTSFYGVHLNAAQIAKFERFERLLRQANQRHNLISTHDESQLVSRHFIDSLLILGLPNFQFDHYKNIIDIGSGAGFPALPLKMCFPESHFTLLDSQRKRIAFIKKTIRELGLGNITTINQRLEAVAADSTYQTGFDLILSRAVENFESIVKNSLPLLQRGGILIFYKGKTVEMELEILNRVLNPLHFEFQVEKPLLPPEIFYQRHFIIIRSRFLTL